MANKQETYFIGNVVDPSAWLHVQELPNMASKHSKDEAEKKAAEARRKHDEAWGKEKSTQAPGL